MGRVGSPNIGKNPYDWDAVGQPGIVVPHLSLAGNGGTPTTLTAVGLQEYAMRFKPSRVYNFTLAAFRLVTAAGSNDTIEIAGTSHSYRREATSGAVAGKLNGSTGITTVPITWTVYPGRIYYCVVKFGAIGTTAAVISGGGIGNTVMSQLFGSAAGIIEADQKAGAAGVIPDPWVGGAGGTTYPIVALRES